MGSRRADRSRSHARPRGGTPARGIVLALSVATVATGAGVTIVAGEGRGGPADRVTANATDAAGDTAGGTTGEVAGGASLPAPPAPRASGSASAGAGGPAEPGRSTAPSASASPSASAPAGKAARAGTTESAGSTGTGSEGTAGPGGEEPASRDSGAGDTPDDDGPEAQVLALVNKEREAAGCRPVTANARLTRAADDYSDVMAASGVMSHTGPDGSTMAGRVEAAGYAWSNLGENIAQGQPDAASVMGAWMNSPGHRANILDCSFEELGVGVHFGDGGPWWTQNFGTSR